jgi:hypothetical protein
MFCRIIWAGVCGLLISVVTAQAAPLYNVPLPGGVLDVEYIAGTGSKTAYFVVDFAGNGGPKHAFGYRFDGTTSVVADGLLAIDAAGGLNTTLSNFGSMSQPNYFIDTLTFGTATDTPNFSVDSRYWHYWIGSYTQPNISWTESNYGISGVDFFSGNVVEFMQDNTFYAFYASANAVTPSVPIAPVPEPSTWLVLSGLAAVGYLCKCQRRVVN